MIYNGKSRTLQNLQTDIDELYDHIKQELQKGSSLKIVSEIKGEMNGQPLRSITAVNGSLVVLAGALREITISNNRYSR